jgi:hypothetical protein
MLSNEDSLLTPEIRLHIAINVVPRLNAVGSLGRCQMRNFRFAISFSTKCSFCRILWSRVWCLVSSRSFLMQGWSLPLPRSRTSLVLRLWRAWWWRGVQWSFAPLILRQRVPSLLP